MYRLKNRVYCSDCIKSYIDVNFTKNLRSLGHINIVRTKTLSNIEAIDPNILVDILRNFHEKLLKSKGII